MIVQATKWKNIYQENDQIIMGKSTNFKINRSYLLDKDIRIVSKQITKNLKAWEDIDLATVDSASSVIWKLAESQRSDIRMMRLLKDAKTEEEVIGALDSSNFKKVAERLGYLREAVKEEGGAIEFQSLRNFGMFTLRERLPTPQIGIGPDGLVEAVWRSPHVGTMVLDFERSGDITFTVLYQQRTLKGRRQRISGELPQDRVMGCIGDFVHKLTAT